MTSRKSPPRQASTRSDSMLPKESESGRARSPSSKNGLLSASAPNRLAATIKADKVKKNPNGGVLITPEEIQMAFQLLDIEKSGNISLQNLKRRLGVLFPELTVKDYRFLMNNKKEMTMDDLKELLIDNEITNFDPVAEAYKVFDQTGEGALSGEKLRNAFLAYGLGELADEELDILIRTADVDGDGVISLEDFRAMIDPAIAANTRKTSVVLPATSGGGPGQSTKVGFGSPSSKAPGSFHAEASSKNQR